MKSIAFLVATGLWKYFGLHMTCPCKYLQWKYYKKYRYYYFEIWENTLLPFNHPMQSRNYHRALNLKLWFMEPYGTAILRTGNIIIVWINNQPTKSLQLSVFPYYVLVSVDCANLTVNGDFEVIHPVVLSYNCVDCLFTLLTVCEALPEASKIIFVSVMQVKTEKCYVECFQYRTKYRVFPDFRA